MAKKKKKKKAKKGFGGVIVPVILTFAVLFSLGYIGKKSLMSGGVNSHLTLNSENEEAGGSGHITGPQSITVEEPRGADMQPQKTQEAVAQNNTQSKESKKTEKKEEKVPAKKESKKTESKPQKKTPTPTASAKPASTATPTPTPKKPSYAQDASVKKLLQTAIKPVGKTMFVFGGGWNNSDSGASAIATTIGLGSKWKSFADKQDSSYDYKNVSDRSLGLDGSGYIGWVLYNTLKTKNGQEGFVMSAGAYDEKLSEMGLGKRTPKEDVTVRRPGDIMCSQSDGFCYIVLGVCSDGSVLLVGSTPPGVRICGTPTSGGNVDSEAILLAEQIMNDHYGSWYRRFPDCAKGTAYLVNYDKFSPDTNAYIKDSEGMRNMSAEQIVGILF